MRRLIAVTSALAAIALAAGCGDGSAGGSGDAALDVVATTTQLADFARQVGGDRVDVQALLPPNADPHDYEPRPSDARAVAEADVVLQSGGDLDAWLGDVIAGAGGDAERVTLMDAVRTIAGGEHAEERAREDDHAAEEEADPHWWQDPRNAVRAVDRIAEAFAAADPAGRAVYAQSARRYSERIRALDAAIGRCMRAIPAERRKLVTSHDAFGHFAERYDIEALGAIVPALSTAAQPSAGDVRRLVAAIRREGVTTIFPESALSQRLERAVAEEAGARVGPALYADTLGPEGSLGATYLGALRHDAAAIAAGFGGDCDLP
jgi:zinc/manganese transport system substrate-binding protein